MQASGRGTPPPLPVFFIVDLLSPFLSPSVILSYYSVVENSCFFTGIFNFEIATNHPPTTTKGSCPSHSPPYLLKGTYTISHLHFPSSFQLLYTPSLHSISLLITLFIPILLVFPSASDYTKLQGKPTFLSMSCHPTGPNMAAQPLPGLPSHAGSQRMTAPFL
jgi:hypothetical protein